MVMEDALSGVLAFYQTAIPNMISTIQSERAVTVPALAFLDVSVNKGRQYPGLEILPVSSDPDYTNEISPLDATGWLTHHVLLRLTVAGNDYSSVQLVMLRYEEAIHRVTKGDNSYGARFVRVRLGNVDFSLAVNDQKEGKMLQRMEQPLEIRTLA
jgi:hypothetical protein